MVITPTPNTPKRILALAELVAASFPERVPAALEIRWRKSRLKRPSSSGSTSCLGRDGDTCAVALIKMTAGAGGTHLASYVSKSLLT